MASSPPTEPDPRTAADDDEDATGQGASTTEPAEGDDTAAPVQPGSPQG
jgi:hypothetical protein